MTVKIDGTNTVANPAFTGADTDTGLQVGTNELNLVTGGTARATVDSSGNMGLGTTSPNNQSAGGYTSLTLNNATNGSILDLRQNDTALSGGRLVGTANTFGLEARAQNASSEISFYVNNAYTGRWTVNGLCFGNDTAAANALDDYDTGTFTPSCILTYNPSGRTITDNGSGSGKYVKVGDLVFCEITVGFTAISGTGSFNVGISGLPFPAENSVQVGGGTGRSNTTGYLFFMESVINSKVNVIRRYDNSPPNVPDNFQCHVTYIAA